MQHLADRLDRRLHALCVNVADAADAEGFYLGQFAGVENETLGLDPLVEVLELVARVFWRMEGDDDRRLDGGWQEAAQTQCCLLYTSPSPRDRG